MWRGTRRVVKCGVFALVALSAAVATEAKVSEGNEATDVKRSEAQAVQGDEERVVPGNEAKAVQGSEAKAVQGSEAKAVQGSEAEGRIVEMRTWLEELDRVREDLQHNDGFLMTDDELVLSLLLEPVQAEGMLLRRYARDPVEAMEDVPGEFFEEMDRKRGSLWEEINRRAAELGTVQGMPASAEDSAAVAARVKETVSGASMLGTVMRDNDWNVRFNALGIPVSRYRRGFAIYRISGQPLAVCQQIAIERPILTLPGREPRTIVRLGFLRFQTYGSVHTDRAS